MKTIFKYIFLFILTCFILHSCNEEEKVKTYNIKYKVYCNTPDIPVTIFTDRDRLIIKNYFEDSNVAKSGETVGVSATCEDKTNLITIEVYVNGVLKAKEKGNSKLRALVVLQ